MKKLVKTFLKTISSPNWNNDRPTVKPSVAMYINAETMPEFETIVYSAVEASCKVLVQSAVYTQSPFASNDVQSNLDKKNYYYLDGYPQ